MTTYVNGETVIYAEWLNQVDLAVPDASNLVVANTTGSGIKLNRASPAFGWRDIIGSVLPDQQGANAPSLVAFRGGNVRRFAFSATDKCDCEFHIPHDYVPGTDLYVHAHWAHNGTAISGNIVLNFHVTYAKRATGAFGAEKTVTITQDTVNVTTTPRWGHMVYETQLSITGGSATLLNTADIEVDGVIGLNFTMGTIPTISGGAPNEPFVFHIDIHYQSTNIGTASKDPNYYGA